MKQLNETVAGTATDIRKKAAEIRQQGFCILPNHFSQKAIEACARAFRPILLDYAQTHSETPNRGPNRYYIPLPFQPPIFNPQFFFDPTILAIHEAVLGENTRIDQFASDTSFNGSVYQDVHADVPALFHEAPEMIHPPQILAMNFPLIRITPNHGPFEVARGSHLLPESEALKKIEAGDISLDPLLLNIGDALIRDTRCLHRGTPNRTDAPRPVAVISCTRTWFYRERERNPIPESIWIRFSDSQQKLMQRFPIDKTGPT